MEIDIFRQIGGNKWVSESVNYLLNRFFQENKSNYPFLNLRANKSTNRLQKKYFCTFCELLVMVLSSCRNKTKKCLKNLLKSF